jgi:hypothetical protein
MKILQTTLKNCQIAPQQLDSLIALSPNLVLVFGAPAFFARGGGAAQLADVFQGAKVVGCSTAGEIDTGGVQNNSAVITAVKFEKSRLVAGTTDLVDMADSHAAGKRLANQIVGPDLRAVLVFGQGLNINGSALVEGMTEVLGTELPITGGLAGDNGAFAKTWTLGKDGASDRALVTIGFSGEDLHVGHGSFGGWEPFGPERRVTRCEGNVLFELDGAPALDVYKRYLGDYAKDLPASGLLFPFAMMGDDPNTTGLIRTILGVDEAQGSLTLAGEIVQDGTLKLMHASTDALVDGAKAAAKAVVSVAKLSAPSLAILVSCVGRKLVMGDRVDEEVEAVADVLGDGSVPTGFYSYGEISPFVPGASCKLHNQTMTITTFAEP